MVADTTTHTETFKAVWDNQQFAAAIAKVENITGIFAQHMLIQAGLREHPKDSPLVVLDNACGGGIFTLQLQAILQDRAKDSFSIQCGDFAEAMVELTKLRIEKEGWSNTAVAQINAEDTKLQNSHYTHVFTNFGLMTFPDPSAALKECHRILQPNGICAFTTWASIPWPKEMKAAMSAVPGLPTLPSDKEMDVPNIFSNQKIWHDAAAVRAYTEKHGFANVESKCVEAMSRLTNPAELRAILKSPVTVITRFFWTLEEREKFDNDETYGKIFEWFERRLERGPMEWVWTAIVTTATKSA